MIGRFLVTAILLFLAAYAFFGNALGAGYLFNPFGILFIFFAAVVWHKWDIVRAGFRAVKEEAELPIIRLASKLIKGMETLRHGPPQRRSSSSNR